MILALAVTSTAFVLIVPKREYTGMGFWIFNKVHQEAYQPRIEQWNREHPDKKVDLFLLHNDAFERRLLAAFTAGTPVADILETERRVASRTFLGPEGTVGFVDLTDRLEAEGLMDVINRPSFAPWTSRGHIYGIPHDVHPMLLAYRSDIIEDEAGIDMSTVKTWDDFYEKLHHLQTDNDGDGRQDRFLLAGWPKTNMFVEGLLRQAGGRYFDEQENLVIADELNARTLAEITTWCIGPRRFCTEVAQQVASGYRLHLEGTVLCSLMPDWMVGQWKRDMPALAGKVKLMPLPAFEPGGRRTSVWGGTMLGISRETKDFEAAWEFAKYIYLSPEIAERTFRKTGIVTPVTTHWDLPVFAEPDPYFGGQPSGQMYIDQAPDVPVRSSTPYERIALERVVAAALDLHAYAEREQKFSAEELLPEARRLLRLAQNEVQSHMDRNVFLNP